MKCVFGKENIGKKLEMIEQDIKSEIDGLHSMIKNKFVDWKHHKASLSPCSEHKKSERQIKSLLKLMERLSDRLDRLEDQLKFESKKAEQGIFEVKYKS